MGTGRLGSPLVLALMQSLAPCSTYWWLEANQSQGFVSIWYKTLIFLLSNRTLSDSNKAQRAPTSLDKRIFENTKSWSQFTFTRVLKYGYWTNIAWIWILGKHCSNMDIKQILLKYGYWTNIAQIWILDISQAMEVLCKNISSVNGSQKICITTISRFALTNVMLFCLGGGQMLGSGVTRHPN